jgi:hypothetical protein
VQNPLKHSSKQLPYQAPYGYFESLEARTLGKLQAQPVPKPLWQGYLAYAGVALLLLVATYAGWQSQQTGTNDWEQLLSQIDHEAKADYLLNQGNPDAFYQLVDFETTVADHWLPELEVDEALQWLEAETLETLMTEL